VPTRVEVLVTFDSNDDIRGFQKAIPEFEGLGDTHAFFVDLSTSLVSHRPTFREMDGKEPQYLAGRIVGPDRKAIPDGDKPVNETAWARDVFDILESHGVELRDETNEAVC
jgi:hypothetical protein